MVRKRFNAGVFYGKMIEFGVENADVFLERTPPPLAGRKDMRMSIVELMMSQREWLGVSVYQAWDAEVTVGHINVL